MLTDYISVPCSNCGADAQKPCVWAPVLDNSEPPPLFHAERIEAAEFGCAAEPASREAWSSAVEATGDI